MPLLPAPEGSADGVCLSTGFSLSLHGFTMSCPRAPASRPGLTAHEQDGHRSLGASEGKRACSGASVLTDAAWAWAGVQRGGNVPPHPSSVAALHCRSIGLLLLGCVLPGTGGGRVLLPLTASHGSGAHGGGRPLAAARGCRLLRLFFFLLKTRNVILAGPRQGPASLRSVRTRTLDMACSARIGAAQEGGRKRKNRVISRYRYREEIT